MNNFPISGAGPPLTFLETTDAHMDFHMSHSTYFDGQHQQIVDGQPMIYEQSPAACSTENANDWPADYPGYQLRMRPQHLSTSTQSSGYSSFQLPDNSFFSDPQNRFSAVSSISTWSNNSTLSNDPCISQAERSYIANPSAPQSYAPSPTEGPNIQVSKRRTRPRTPAQGKDYYKTCVSRKQRTRHTETVQKYFCTICEEAFVGKADWKRHEETFQERPEEYQCDFCYAKYFLDRDFVGHHVKGHSCVPCSQNTKCSEKRHVQSAKKKRTTRTGWGCGFCYHFTTSWTDRCDHVARHFEKDGKTMKNWNHNLVIRSLIQRPAILTEWNKILRSKQRDFLSFGWDKHSTGRVEGYPDRNDTLQLQDALEFYTSDQDAARLARAAYDQAVKQVARERAQSPVAPPVPPKDYHMNHKTSSQDIMKESLQDIMKETESWTQLTRSIIDDDWLPTGVAHPENGALDDASCSWFETSR